MNIIKSFQELQEMIEGQNRRIESLEQENAMLEEEMEWMSVSLTDSRQ